MTTETISDVTEHMSSIDTLRLVYGQRRYAVASLLLFPLLAIFYAWAAQVLLVGPQGLSLLLEPDVITVIVVLAFVFAVTVPLQVYAARVAAAGARQVGGTILGVLTGTASMSCCAPVLLPAVLSLIGFSGTTILSVNLTIHRYFVPLAVLGIILLGSSMVSTVSSLGRACLLRSGN